MKIDQLDEGVGRIVKGVNTTPDVGVDQVSKEAAKFGFKVDKDGRPPVISKKAKNNPNTLFNLGLTENSIFEALEEAWSTKYKRSINCNNPKGFSQKAHCAGRTKRETIMNLKSLVKETIKEVMVEKKVNMFFEENKPTNPSKWSYYKSQAKKKFDVYPSAYANAWAAKQYKAAGGGWRKG